MENIDDYSLLIKLVHENCICGRIQINLLHLTIQRILPHKENLPFILLYPYFQSALKAIISRDSFCAPEVYIFQGVHEWVERNADLTQEQIQEILSQIRLPLISLSVSVS